MIEKDSNFRKFAFSHCYEPRTVTQVVQRWAGHDTLPRGRLSLQILRDLSYTIKRAESALPLLPKPAQGGLVGAATFP